MSKRRLLISLSIAGIALLTGHVLAGQPAVTTQPATQPSEWHFEVVSKEKYDALKLDRDHLLELLTQAQTEATAARAEANAYKKQLQAYLNKEAEKKP